MKRDRPTLAVEVDCISGLLDRFGRVHFGQSWYAVIGHSGSYTFGENDSLFSPECLW